jgi:hypothetical protein
MSCTSTAEKLGIVLEFSLQRMEVIHYDCPDDVVKRQGWHSYQFDSIEDVVAVLGGEGKAYATPVRRALLRHLAWHGRGEGLGEELELGAEDAKWLVAEVAEANIYDTVASYMLRNKPDGDYGQRVYKDMAVSLAEINTVGGGAGIEALHLVTKAWAETISNSADSSEDEVVAWLGKMVDELQEPLLQLGVAKEGGVGQTGIDGAARPNRVATVATLLRETNEALRNADKGGGNVAAGLAASQAARIVGRYDGLQGYIQLPNIIRIAKQP